MLLRTISQSFFAMALGLSVSFGAIGDAQAQSSSRGTSSSGSSSRSAPSGAGSNSRASTPAGSNSRATTNSGSASRSTTSSGSASRGVASNTAMSGYCAVCVVDSKQWLKGSPSFAASFDGKTYHFPGEEQRQAFLANPSRYAPVLGGDCAVCLVDLGKRVPGTVQHAALSDGRLFLFPDAAVRQKFLDNPGRYTNADLAHNGECTVCRVDLQKNVAGNPAFTSTHHGMRYQFMSAEQQQTFVSNPSRYALPSPGAAAGSGSRPAAAHDGSSSRASSNAGSATKPAGGSNSRSSTSAGSGSKPAAGGSNSRTSTGSGSKPAAAGSNSRSSTGAGSGSRTPSSGSSSR